MLVRLDQERFVAYDQKCTHLSCPVLPEIEASRFHCPCHEGSFDLATGRPLGRVQLEIRDGRIYASGLERRTS